MSVLGYYVTLDRFGLEELRRGGDLQVKDGDLAVTADGDLQFGDTKFNGLFRFVERWRINQPTLDELFESMLVTSQRLQDVLQARKQGIGPSLSRDAAAFHEETESIGDYESGSSVFAGAILVVLNNLLQRLKKDLGAPEHRWKSAEPKIGGYSIGAVFSAAAANFRHYDEWARTRSINPTQSVSIEVLCAILARPVVTNGFAAIRTNVCREVLMTVSGGSVDRLHEVTFDYAKALSK
jgi:hypothetical protein